MKGFIRSDRSDLDWPILMEPCSVSDHGPSGGQGAGNGRAYWLRTLGLERYEAVFRENDVITEILRDLTAEDLEGLGVVSIGTITELVLV
jgi:hypothetical protein